MIIRTNRRGFSVIEAMTAVVILSCALVVILRSYVTSMTAARVQEQYVKATVLLSDELDAVMMRGLIDGDFNRSYRKTVGDDVFEVMVSTKPVPGRAINQVDVRVFWPSGYLRQRTISTFTYLLDVAQERPDVKK